MNRPLRSPLDRGARPQLDSPLAPRAMRARPFPFGAALDGSHARVDCPPQRGADSRLLSKASTKAQMSAPAEGVRLDICPPHRCCASQCDLGVRVLGAAATVS